MHEQLAQVLHVKELFQQIRTRRWADGRKEYGGSEFHSPIGWHGEGMEECADGANYSEVGLSESEFCPDEIRKIMKLVTEAGERFLHLQIYNSPMPDIHPPQGANCEDANLQK